MRKINLKTSMKVTNLRELKQLCPGRFFILLVHAGNKISVKDIEWIPKTMRFKVLNHADGTIQTLTEVQITDPMICNIGRAMRLGVFYFIESLKNHKT